MRNRHSFETEERYLMTAEIVHSQALSRSCTGLLPENLEGVPVDLVEAMPAPCLPVPPPKPAGKATETARAEALPPYVFEVEVSCDECGGSGFDPGGLDPWGPEPCPACQGAKTQRIKRNFLTEAFQIAADPGSTRAVERQHLVAVIQHCREAVSALVILPEVA
jgi:hypothetical protein